MKLEDLAPPRGARHKKKRIGRGSGSGWGKTAARGTKGQKSRTSGGVPPWFEGGQMPLQRRVPKGGFKNRFKQYYNVVNLKALTDPERFPEERPVEPRDLIDAGLIKKEGEPIKLLGDGEFSRALTIRVHKASTAAVRRVEEAGGRVELIGAAEPAAGEPEAETGESPAPAEEHRGEED
jgi:large subunit ribosomal protein L15